MSVVPVETPLDLTERYRQLRPFDEAESALVRILVDREDALEPKQVVRLRQALNLARLWVVPQGPDLELTVGPRLGALRDRVRVLATALSEATPQTIRELGQDADAIAPYVESAAEDLLSHFEGRMLRSAFDHEIGTKSLAIALGGGGGAGYMHLGLFSALDEIGVEPALCVGSSMGSVLGLFRCRRQAYRADTVRAVTHGLTFKRLFRILEGDAQYGLPGTLRLYLRSALSRFFVGSDGETMRMGDLEIPFICVVTGIQRTPLETRIADYERKFAQEFRRGPFGALLHIKDLVSSWSALMTDLVRSGAMAPLALGIDAHTQDFDVLDSVGFSCAVPALIHYDILRDDPRMHGLLREFLKTAQVDHLVDGGVSANVPARFAWEAVQRGRIGTRNVFILGCDCFAPQLKRNMLFLPLMTFAAENVEKDRAFMNHMFTYKRILSPAALVPGPRGLERAQKNGHREFQTEAPFIKKMLEPVPPIRGKNES